MRKPRFALAVFAAVAMSIIGSASAETSARRAVTMADLFALTDLGGPLRPRMALSPDGRMLALFERTIDLAANRYRHDLIVVDLRARTAARIADAGDIILRSLDGYRSGAGLEREPVWSPDQQWIYYLRERDGHIETWRVHPNGSSHEAVASGNADVRRFALIDNGRILAYETATPRTALQAQRSAEELSGFRVEERFAALSGLRPPFNENAGSNIWRRNLTTGEIVDGDMRDLEQPDGGMAVRIAPIDSETNVARPALSLSFNIPRGELRCTHALCTGAMEEAWDVESEGTLLVIFRRLEGFAREDEAIYVWRLHDQSVRLVHRVRGKLEGCVIGESALYCLQQSSLQPRQLVRIDVESGAVDVIHDPNPQWRTMRLPRVERLYYADSEGNQSFADLVYPRDYRRGQLYPLIVVQYRSRGFLRGGTGEETPILPMSARGYFVLSVDRPEFDSRAGRLSLAEITRETELDDSEHIRKREAILAFIEETTQSGLVDAERLGITGLSDGAETLFDMLSDAPIFAAAVSSSPPNDPIAWSLQSLSFRRERHSSLGLRAPWDATAPEWSAWWRENTPANHVDRIHAALMLNLSDAEALRAFPFIARLQETSTPIETYIYSGAYHLKWRPSQLWAAQERTVAWFEFWLRSRIVSDINDPARAMRWRELAANAHAARSGSD